MAKDSDRLAGHFEAEDAGGLFSGLIADENEFDTRSLWRIGSWAVAAVGAVVIAVMANQASLGWRRDQVGAADLAREAEQIESLIRENQNETRRLASALETLNADRDRLFSRVTVLEQGFESVTGAISRQSVTAQPAQGIAAQGTALKQTAPVELPPSASQAVAPSPPPVITAPMEASEKRQEPAAPDSHSPSLPPPPPTVTSVQAPPPNPSVSAQQAAAPTPLPAPIFIPARPRSASTKRIESPKRASTGADVRAAVEAATPAQLNQEPQKALDASKSQEPKPQETSKLQEPPKLQEPLKVQEPPKVQEPAKTQESSKTQDPSKIQESSKIQEFSKIQESSKIQDPSKMQDSSRIQDSSDSGPKVAALRTKFAVDIGTANSIAGLRALWRGLAKSNPELAALRPIIVIKENNTGLGMQLRLAAGPVTDAALAAQICAKLIESERTCETTVFDGQRLAMKAENAPSPTGGIPTSSQSRGNQKRAKREDALPPAPNTDPSTLSSLFSRKPGLP